MSISFGPILLSQPKPLLFYKKTAKNTASFAFYMDDIFEAFKTYQNQYIFLYDHFILHLVWSKLKLAFSIFKIGMTKIFIFRKEHKIDRKVILKPNKIEKIFTWLIPQDWTAIKAFFDTIQSIYHYILGFTELIYPLTHLIKKIE